MSTQPQIAQGGVLENMLLRIEQLEGQVGQIGQHIMAGAGFQQGGQPQPVPQYVQQEQLAPQFQQPTSQQYAPQPMQQTVQGQVSADAITNLINPVLDNPQIKAALQAEMQAMGIPELPAAQPHQYGEMYQRFSNVIAAFQAQQQAAPQAPMPQGGFQQSVQQYQQPGGFQAPPQQFAQQPVQQYQQPGGPPPII